MRVYVYIELVYTYLELDTNYPDWKEWKIVCYN